MNQPLAGVRVIDVSSVACGPSAARLLADWGADVIKVEPLYGDMSRQRLPEQKYALSFECYNANKRGIAVDLKTEEGAAIIRTLLKTADVFISNYRYPALQRLGLDYETLQPDYPGLVWAHLSSVGTEGEEANAPAYDIGAFWSRSGLLSEMGKEGQTPINPPFSFGDLTTSCSLTAGICAALYQKSRTGRGEKIMCSLFSQALYGMSQSVMVSQENDQPELRRLPNPMMQSYRCKDGQRLMLTVLEYDRYFGAVMRVIGREDLLGSVFSSYCAMLPEAAQFTQILAEGFAALTFEEAAARLHAADVAFSKVQSIEETLQDPQVAANEYLRPYHCPDGTLLQQPVGPIKFGDVRNLPVKSAPELGEDTESILKESGFTDDQIQTLIDKHIIHTQKRE